LYKEDATYSEFVGLGIRDAQCLSEDDGWMLFCRVEEQCLFEDDGCMMFYRVEEQSQLWRIRGIF